MTIVVSHVGIDSPYVDGPSCELCSGAGPDADVIAVSGSDGRVDLRSARFGPVTCRVSHPDYTLIDIQPATWHTIDQSPQDVEFVLDLIVGVFFEIGEQVVTHSVRVPRHLIIPGAGLEHLRRVQARVLSRGNQGKSVCQLFTMRGSADVDLGQAPEVKVSVLTASSGWVDVKARVRLLRDLIEPDRLDFVPSSDGSPCVKVATNGQHGNGDTAHERIRLVPSRGASPDWSKSVVFTLGDEIVVPHGTYQVQALNAFVGKVIEPKQLVVGESTTALQFSLPGVVPVTFRVRRGDEAVQVSGTVTISADDTPVTAFLQKGEVKFSVPTGKIVCQVHAPGCSPNPMTFDVGARQSEIFLQVQE